MAEVVADRLLGGHATFPGADTSTKLSCSGSTSPASATPSPRRPVPSRWCYADRSASAYKKLVVSDDASTLLGGVLVGDASAYTALRPLLGAELGGDPTAWLLPGRGAAPTEQRMPDAATVCSCNNVGAGAVRDAVPSTGAPMSVRSRPARRPAAAAVRACRWSSS